LLRLNYADEHIDPGINLDHNIVMLSRSEASFGPAQQTFRGVYPERQRRAQHDSAVADFIIRLFFETALSRPLSLFPIHIQIRHRSGESTPESSERSASLGHTLAPGSSAL
jgi:hypothetical protein